MRKINPNAIQNFLKIHYTVNSEHFAYLELKVSHVIKLIHKCSIQITKLKDMVHFLFSKKAEGIKGKQINLKYRKKNGKIWSFS